MIPSCSSEEVQCAIDAENAVRSLRIASDNRIANLVKTLQAIEALVDAGPIDSYAAILDRVRTLVDDALFREQDDEDDEVDSSQPEGGA